MYVCTYVCMYVCMYVAQKTKERLDTFSKYNVVKRGGLQNLLKVVKCLTV